jgi:hypothetical protein
VTGGRLRNGDMDSGGVEHAFEPRPAAMGCMHAMRFNLKQQRILIGMGTRDIYIKKEKDLTRAAGLELYFSYLYIYLPLSLSAIPFPPKTYTSRTVPGKTSKGQ